MSGEDLILERLAKIEEKLERLAVLEQRLEDFARPWDSLVDLGRDASLLVAPAAHLLTEELAEVETGFQLEDILAMVKQLLLSFRHLTWALEQLENLIDLWRDLEPMLRLAVPHLIDKLDELEQQGIFRINKAMLGMYAKLAATYTAEDIDAIGDGFVRMHGLVKKLAEPEMVDFLERLSHLPAGVRLEEAKPTGPVGLMFRLMNREARRGLGVAVELTKALGRLPESAGEQSS
ncbi:MAG: DUF1641 domain-containing protein, partial [Desulfobacca sp.]|uniref:DUF1641 domain-containing protein n=1 Tax=Desulfobacca sp. TaxID=2067990 RepID=UPI00404B7060